MFRFGRFLKTRLNQGWNRLKLSVMLDDRFYMREPQPPPRRPYSAAIILLILNAVIFLVQWTLPDAASSAFQDYFALSWETLKQGMIWQLISFQFLHGGWMHILFNSIGIYMFGRPVEATLGSRNFCKLYLISGVVGGLVHVLGSWILPANFGGIHSAVVGASAGAYGLIAAYAVLFPHNKITILVFFIIPVTLTARVMLFAAAALAVFGIVNPQGNVAEGAHLGGLLYGLIFVKALLHSNWRFPQFGWGRKKTQDTGRPVPESSKREWGKASSTQLYESESSVEFISREVDPILDKISSQGIQSLTEKERKILESARAKMSKT